MSEIEEINLTENSFEENLICLNSYTSPKISVQTKCNGNTKELKINNWCKVLELYFKIPNFVR